MKPIEEKAITSIRILVAETVEKAKSGHPGLAIGSAPLAFTLWKQMKHDPKSPSWQGRDRFILSAGHASTLEYSLLHLFGYGLTMEDMQSFRQWGSKTPGHPEFGHTVGVEATTGPLGQGFAMGVGMAMAEAKLAAEFNRDGYPVVDNYTYVVTGDGCQMEGATSEAASLAGHLGLGKLIVLYDRNDITIEGALNLAFTEDVAKRYEAYDWHVQTVSDGENTALIDEAIQAAKAEKTRPSIIIVHTTIGFGTSKAGTASAHGEPLGEACIADMKKHFGWPEDAFYIPQDVYDYFDALLPAYEKQRLAYEAMFAAYRKAYPELAEKWDLWHASELPEALKKDERLWNATAPQATRNASGAVLNVLAEYLPNLFGGSADLAPSNKTELKGRGFFSKENYAGSNIHFGIREFAMTCACNGIMLYGGLRAFCATFFVFADYLKPAMRLSALMKLPILFVLTHDSIGVGEDGPTHQPIEQLAMLRATPNVYVYRPADAKETAACYLSALEGRHPSVMALTRQNLPQYAETGEGVSRGGYILRDAENGKPDLILIASGSEVELIYKAYDLLTAEGVACRVVSMPCMELFNEQDEAYRESVLPNTVRARVAVEAGTSFGWRNYVGLDGECICLDRFGSSASYARVFKEFGFTVDHVVETAKKMLTRV